MYDPDVTEQSHRDEAEKQPEPEPERQLPGERTVPLAHYLEKDEAVGGKVYRGQHAVPDQPE
jgi:hypothetical protein